MIEEQDKKLADKGWQSMQELLDREMPVERKRRPFGWWWLGLLLLPLAILGSRTWWQPASPQLTKPAPTILKTDRPVVQQAIDHQNTTLQKQSVNPGILSQQQSPIQQTKTIVGAGTHVPVVAGKILPAIAPSATTTPTQAADITSVVPTSVPSAFTEVSPSFVTATGVQTPETTTPDQPTGTIAARFVASTAPLDLPFLAAQTERTNSTTSARTFAPIRQVEHASTKPLKTTPRWAFGLTAAVATEHFATLNGLSAGFTTDWRFARKWGLRSAVLYTRYQPSESKQPVVAVNEVRYSNATGLQPGSFNPGNVASSTDINVADGYVYIPLRKLHQMEIPVMAWWQPHPTFRVYSGLSASYTFLGQSAKQNFVDNSIVSLDTHTSQKGANQVATQELQRWQLNYQAGLGLRLGRHVELSAFWRTPVRKIFSKPSDLASYNSATEELFESTITSSSSSTKLPNTGRFILQGTWLF